MNIIVVDDEEDVQPLFKQQFRREMKNGADDYIEKPVEFVQLKEKILQL